jgi:hypothetical protein
MSSDLKGLQENNEYLMEINQEFGRENDQLSADLKRYQQSDRENDQLSADLKRYQQSFEPRSNKRKGKKKNQKKKDKRVVRTLNRRKNALLDIRAVQRIVVRMKVHPVHMTTKRAPGFVQFS